MQNLAEAFSKLNLIESSEFDINSAEGKEALDDFMSTVNSTEDEVTNEIIDPEAEDELELSDSYVGKAVVQCPVCKSLIYRDMDEIENMEEEQCPYCYTDVEMEVVGKIVPIDTPVQEESEEVCPECGENPCVCDADADAPMDESVKRRARGKRLAENIKKRNRKLMKEDITITTNDGTEIKIDGENNSAPEDFGDFSTDSFDVPELGDGEGTEEVIAPLDSEEGEVDEVDEDSFDEMAESLLKDNYKNITSYKTKKMTDKGNHFIAEGVITLANGQRRLTEFRVRPSKFSRDGKGACLIENLQLGKKKVVKARVAESKKNINEGIFGKKKERSDGRKCPLTQDQIKAKVSQKFGNNSNYVWTESGKEKAGRNAKEYYVMVSLPGEDRFKIDMNRHYIPSESAARKIADYIVEISKNTAECSVGGM